MLQGIIIKKVLDLVMKQLLKQFKLDKIQEYVDAEPMRQLREERNERLAETDWTQGRDVTLSNDSDWKNYRQELRDLPSTASPTLDERGLLTNVTFPEKP